MHQLLTYDQINFATKQTSSSVNTRDLPTSAASLYIQMSSFPCVAMVYFFVPKKKNQQKLEAHEEQG
ncbi:unnamed protein product [Linum trigynum]|uniref:Uncharacterized protein n=1 Tax=Linum trigynum TaxID=586398 RepID=A0AAV2F5B8_9ROSI